MQWTVDSLDWKGLSATEILSRVNKGVKNGSIILFHNNSDNILEALPLVIANLKLQFIVVHLFVVHIYLQLCFIV